MAQYAFMIGDKVDTLIKAFQFTQWERLEDEKDADRWIQSIPGLATTTIKGSKDKAVFEFIFEDSSTVDMNVWDWAYLDGDGKLCVMSDEEFHHKCMLLTEQMESEFYAERLAKIKEAIEKLGKLTIWDDRWSTRTRAQQERSLEKLLELYKQADEIIDKHRTLSYLWE